MIIEKWSSLKLLSQFKPKLYMWYEYLLDGPIYKLYPIGSNSIQDGHICKKVKIIKGVKVDAILNYRMHKGDLILIRLVCGRFSAANLILQIV